MEYQTAKDAIVCQPGDTFVMHEGRPTLMRDGQPVAVAWANTREDFEIRTPEPKPQCYVTMEYKYLAHGIEWVSWRIGPMSRSQADSLATACRSSSYHRNVQIVEAQRKWWVGNNSGEVFVYSSRELAIRTGWSQPVLWDGKAKIVGYIYPEPRP